VSVLWARDGSLRRSVADDRGQSLWDWKIGLAFSPDSRSLAFGVQAPEVRVLDLQDGAVQRLAKPERGMVMALAFSPDGRSLVSGDRNSEFTI